MIVSLFGITYRAEALGLRSTVNCGVDYFKYCSQYPVNSNEVRDCFKQNGRNLSPSCVNALIADGEVTKEEVEAEKEKIKEEETKPVEVPIEEVKPAEPEVQTPVVEEKPKEEIARIIIGKVINKTRQVSVKIKTAVKKNNDKWKNYPKFLEPYSNVPKDTMGSTITNYGIYDR